MPPELKTRVVDAAKKSGRSLHAEIIARLGASFLIGEESDPGDSYPDGSWQKEMSESLRAMVWQNRFMSLEMRESNLLTQYTAATVEAAEAMREGNSEGERRAKDRIGYLLNEIEFVRLQRSSLDDQVRRSQDPDDAAKELELRHLIEKNFDRLYSAPSAGPTSQGLVGALKQTPPQFLMICRVLSSRI
jgi:hypothetical protein